MICIQFTTGTPELDTAGAIGAELQKALMAALEKDLRDDASFPIISSVEGGKLRINVKIGAVEAVFEEDLEETFEAFLDPLVSERGAEMAEILEGIARRMREADLRRKSPTDDGPA